MPIDQISAVFNFLQISLLFKLLLLVLSFFYFVFSVVVHRQISLMVQILDSKISPLVKSIALGQIIATAILFLLVMVFG